MLVDLDVSCSAYTYFRQCVEQLRQAMLATNRTFTLQMIDNIPQYFSYERSKYLVGWLLVLLYYQNCTSFLCSV